MYDLLLLLYSGKIICQAFFWKKAKKFLSGKHDAPGIYRQTSGF